MSSSIRNWGSDVYKNWASYWSSLPKHEVGPWQCTILFFGAPALALGIQHLGSFSLQPAIVAFVVADLAFHYFAENSTNPDIHAKARKFAWLIYGARLAVLAWNTGYLLQSLSNWTNLFPLSSESTLRIYSTPGWCGLVLSGTVAGVAMHALTKFKQWDIENQLNLEELNRNNRFIYLREHYLPFWTTALQLMVHISLAVFSTSHLTFAALFTFSLYTLHQRVSHRKISVELNFEERGINFHYEEMFVVKENAKEEVTNKCNHLMEKKKRFKSFNRLRKEADCVRLYVSEKPFSGDVSSQLLHKHLSFHLSGDARKVKLNCIQIYQPGQEIQIDLDHQRLEKSIRKNKDLTIELEDGTSVHFPNVLTRKLSVKELEGKTIKAQILSTSCDPTRQLELTCSSLHLPEWEELCIEQKSTQYGKNFTFKYSNPICADAGRGPCSGCSKVSKFYRYDGGRANNQQLCRTCIQTDFENKVKTSKLTVFNFREQGYFSYEAYVEDPLPEDIKVNVWVEINGLQRPVSISQIKNYQIGDRVQVEIGVSRIQFLYRYSTYDNQRSAYYDADQNAVFAYLPDGTMVVFPNVSSWNAQILTSGERTTITAQVTYKCIQKEQGFLYLACVSDKLPIDKGIVVNQCFENDWSEFLDGVLQDLNNEEMRKKIASLEKNGALNLFLQKIRNKKSRRECLGIKERLGIFEARGGWIQRQSVENAYKEMVMVIHPDRNRQNQQVATVLFKALRQAYSSLQQQLSG